MTLVPARTALVLIDLQTGILANSFAPHSSEDVVARSAKLADAFRAAGAPVILVTVNWHKGFVDSPMQEVDIPTVRAPDGPPAEFAVIHSNIGPKEGDVCVVKRQWGAFYGTDLDLQLRRRGVDTIVLAGVATNLGVESTARSAWEHGYSLIFAEDATSSFTADMHTFAFKAILPRIGKVSDSATIAAQLTPVG